MTFPPRYQLPSFKPYRKAPGTPGLFDSATTADFRAIASSFHNEFFAEHPDTEIFTNIVKLLLAKIYDERFRRPGEQYEFQVLQVSGREETAASVAARVSGLYETAYKALIDSAGGDALDPKVFSPERVKSVVKGLQAVAITRGAALHGDIIGAFFEEILRAGFKQDKGMYFTHSNLVWFMLEGVDLPGLTSDTWRNATHPNNRMPYVIDPACGSGAFLLRAMQMMSDSIRANRTELVLTQDDQRYFDSHLSDSNPNEWAKDFLYGCDPKFVMAITAKVNMVLHGDGSAHIFKWDSLKSLSLAPDIRLQPVADPKRSVSTAKYRFDVAEQFDLVISNPPFGIRLSPETDKHVNNVFNLGSKTSSEGLFIERYAQILRPGGRMAVVVPESLLNTGDSRNVRLLLFRFFHVRAVVSLPRNLFVETPTLTSLLFAQKKNASEIAAWDTEWDKCRATVLAAVDAARKASRIAAAGHGATADDVQTAFVGALGGLLTELDFVRTRGRNARMLGVRLPSGVSVVEALGHYHALLRATGFANLITQATLRLVTAKLNYTWPAYAVDEVGYKLSKRGERVRPNQLVRFVDANGMERPNVQKSEGSVTPIVTTGTPERVLDYMRRDVQWS